MPFNFAINYSSYRGGFRILRNSCDGAFLEKKRVKAATFSKMQLWII